MIETEEKELLTVKDTMRVLGLGRDSVYTLLHGGKIPHVRLGKSFRVPRASLIRFLEQEAEAAVSAPSEAV